MARRTVGTFVPRALLHALNGDVGAAIVFAQSCWVQEQFDGAWSTGMGWWTEALGMSRKAATRAFRALEKLGWVSITRRGSDSTWWIEVHEEEAEASMALTSDHWALVWDVRGDRRNPSNSPMSPKGNANGVGTLPQRDRAPYPKGQTAPVCVDSKPKKGAKDLGGEDLGKEERNPDAEPLSSPSLPDRPGSPDPSRPASSGSASKRAGLSQEDLVCGLVACYPHPSHGFQVVKPHPQQVEIWIGDLIRLGALAPDGYQELLQKAQQLARMAKADPDHWGRRVRQLRNWLRGLDWKATIEEPEETPQRIKLPTEQRDPSRPRFTPKGWGKGRTEQE